MWAANESYALKMDIIVILENVFKSENCQSDLNLFCNQIYNNDQSGVDLATEQLSNIITSATEAVIPIKPSNSIRKTKKIQEKVV